MELNVTSANKLDIYKNLNINCKSSITPEKAENRPLDKEKVLEQLNKTKSFPYEFKNIKINLENGVFLSKISALNELRRTSLNSVYDFAVSNIKRSSSNIKYDVLKESSVSRPDNKQISVLLNILHLDFDYSSLTGFDNVYIPLKYFSNAKYAKILDSLQENFSLYIYMPTILKANYRNLFYNVIENTISNYSIKGFVVSNLSNFELLKDLLSHNKNLELIGNYTLNIFNCYSVNELKNLGIKKFTLSPESDLDILTTLCNHCNLPSELIVYGNVPLMNMNYCLNRKNK